MAAQFITATPPRSSKVVAWLGGLPSQQVAHDTPVNTNKRRRPLRELDINMNTPRKALRRQLDSVDDLSCTGVMPGVGEEEDTPRAPSAAALTSSATIPFVDRPVFTPSRPRTDDNPSSVHSSSTADTSRKRKRSSSPIKKMATLQYAEYGVEQRLIGRWKDMPEPLQPLVRAMKNTGMGRGIIPTEHAEALLPLIAEDPEDDRLASDTRDLLGSCPSLPFVKHTLRHISQNIALARSEAAWNCNVHAPLLDQAWMYSKHGSRVRWENISTASIEPATLLPTLTFTELFASKKADFAITLELDTDTVRRLVRSGVTSLGQSYYEPVRYSPIAVSIETKTPGESGDSAQLQLNTWALAQVAKLKELLNKVGNSEMDIPALPLVVVQGNEWKFFYLENGEKKAQLWSHITVGDTGSVRGIYQVATALQQLLEWSETVYRPWFDTSILTPLLATIP